MHDLHVEAQLPLTVRLTLASEVSPGTDGTAPTHLYSPTFSYFTSCNDSVPSWESTSDPWRDMNAQRDILFSGRQAHYNSLNASADAVQESSPSHAGKAGNDTFFHVWWISVSGQLVMINLCLTASKLVLTGVFLRELMSSREKKPFVVFFFLFCF